MFLSIHMYIDIHISPLCFNIYIYVIREREERSIYAMSRNLRVYPAQSNVWCCAVERSVTLHGSHGSYSSQSGNVGYQALATAKSRTAHRSRCDRCGNRPVPVSLALNIIHSEQNHIRNMTLHHSSIKANEC